MNDYEDDDNELEAALADCSLHDSGGVWHCMQVGSEYCEFSCPFNGDIGKPVSDEPII